MEIHQMKRLFILTLIFIIGCKKSDDVILTVPSTEKSIFKLTINIDAGGSVEIKSQKSNQTKIFKESQVIEYDLGDVLTLTAKSNDGYLFDGWSGEIEDRLNMTESNSLTISKPINLNIHFVKMYAGGKLMQNEFSDASMLNFRSSENFIVWWDKSYD